MKLETIAKKNNVKIIDKGNGHIQLKGALLVNYYPNSVKRTAYIQGMKNSRKHVTPKEAVLMAVQVPMANGKKEPRKKNYKAAKNILFNKKQECHWCGTPLTRKQATLDHVIPLVKGGLNNMNNYVLACEDCNQKRGCSMPEIGEKNGPTN